MVRRCSNSSCDVGTTGVCVESFALNDCPHFLGDDHRSLTVADDAADAALNVPDAFTPGDGIKLAGGDVLDIAGADKLLRERGGVLIALVAGHGTGKTTLIAAMYELLRRRLLPPSFCGCETIRGFEKRLHLARESCGASRPETVRTRRANVEFLHVAVASPGQFPTDVVFCDRAGETYEMALDTPSSLASLPELARADRIAVVVDGAALRELPHPTIASARRSVLTLALHLHEKKRAIGLVVTKADLLDEPERREAEAFLTDLVDELRSRDVELPTLFVGSRAEAGQPYGGKGFPELLEWILNRTTSKPYQAVSPLNTGSSHPFNRLATNEGLT